MKQQLLRIALLLASSAAVHGQDPSAPARSTAKQPARAADDPAGNKAWLAHGFTGPQRESLREAFRWGMENRFIPGGAVLVIHRGEPVFREAFGLADVETKRPFTVDKYLPQFARVTIRGTGVAARSPKIRELLAHTAGFPSNNDRRSGAASFKTDGTLSDAVDNLARAELATQPGTVFAYTGLGCLVAGRVAEVVTGQEFGALMSERLLNSP